MNLGKATEKDIEARAAAVGSAGAAEKKAQGKKAAGRRKAKASASARRTGNREPRSDGNRGSVQSGTPGIGSAIRKFFDF